MHDHKKCYLVLKLSFKTTVFWFTVQFVSMATLDFSKYYFAPFPFNNF